MFLGLLFIIAVSIFIAYVSLLPEQYRIERATVINATPHAVYQEINDLQRWDRWSPWAKLDPTSTVAYDGPPMGFGQSMAWSGDKRVGKGKMTISESLQDERIRLKLDLEKPAKSTSDVQFDLKPVGEDRTEVVWSMSGKRDFVAKAVNLLMKVEQMIGEQYDQGLANLKAAVENAKQGAS